MIRSGASSNLVLCSLVFEYGCDAMILLDSELTLDRLLGHAARMNEVMGPGHVGHGL